MPKNGNLNKAKKIKNDEFYTQLVDIENELRFYANFFKNKVVYCNCNDATESNFFKYFCDRFEDLGIKKLISTEYNETGFGNIIAYDKDGIKSYELKGNGDFRSEECIEFLKEADVVVTNPPFSLFRQYVSQLMEYGKKFLILSNNNAITYKEFFPLIKENKVWLGRTLFTGKMPFFKVPDDYRTENERYEIREDGLYKQVNAICWFTNIPNDDKRDVLYAYKKYNELEYPEYDNYNAINIDRMTDFPVDYEGVMGIPITGLKYLWSDGTIHVDIDGKTERFEIVGNPDANIVPEGWKGASERFVKLYYEQGNRGIFNPGNRLACFVDCDGKAKVPYKRILVKKK